MKTYYSKDFPAYEFDSKEELEFFYWLKELESEKLINNIIYHPEPILLCESFKETFIENYKEKLKTIIQKKTYTPDFLFQITEKFKEIFPNIFFPKNNQIWVDVKGAQTNGKFVNSSAYTFPIKQAWVYSKYGIYIQKVVCRPKKSKDEIKEKNLFLSTFVPLKVLYLTKSKEIKIAKDFNNEYAKTLNEVLYGKR